MEYIIHFDICSIPIFLIILITVFVRKMTHGIANRLFIALIIVSMVSAVSDLLNVIICSEYPLSDADVFFGNVVNYLYFISRNATIVIYFFFIYAITRTWYRVKSKKMQALLLFPFAVEMAALLINPFTGIIFTVDAENGYFRGNFIIILYTISIMYAFSGTFYLVGFCRKFLGRSKIVSLVALYLMSLGAAVIQFFFPRYLIEMIFTAISLILVVLFVLRPEEISDASVGSMSYGALRTELKKVLLTNHSINMAVIRFINGNEVRSYFGVERYLLYVSHVLRQLETLLKREKLDFEVYFEHPGLVYILVDNMGYNFEDATKRLGEELRRRSEKFVGASERLVPKVCSMRIPDDIGDFDEIIRLCHDFHTLMPQDKIYADASEIMQSRDYKVISHMDLILNRAISENKFEMYYQPIYSIEKQSFVSAEALIRLTDEEFGFVSPGLFIPAAERKGVIIPIGDFVLDDVHRFISENDFDELGLNYIEINLSVAQCFQQDLPDKLNALKEKYGVTPDKINLEITETTYEDIGKVMDTNLKKLSSMGYTFSLDDYGTGYSNMQRVSRLPLKLIKLDKTLVDDMGSDDGMSIVRNTVKMMRDIDKELVAEGVETKENLDQLKDMGCHFIQGYYFSKPLPAKEFIDFIRTNNRVSERA